MNYNWTNNAYWLLRLRLKPGAWADQQYSIGHDFQKNQLQQCTVQCQCDYNVSILVLQQYVTRSSADADNGLEAFSSQSRSTNMVPFWVHCDFSLSM